MSIVSLTPELSCERADNGDRLRHGRSAWSAEREDERATRKGRHEAVHAVDGVAGSGIGGGEITAAQSPEPRIPSFRIELTHCAFELADADTVRKAGVSINSNPMPAEASRSRLSRTTPPATSAPMCSTGSSKVTWPTGWTICYREPALRSNAP